MLSLFDCNKAQNDAPKSVIEPVPNLEITSRVISETELSDEKEVELSNEKEIDNSIDQQSDNSYYSISTSSNTIEKQETEVIGKASATEKLSAS